MEYLGQALIKKYVFPHVSLYILVFKQTSQLRYVSMRPFSSPERGRIEH